MENRWALISHFHNFQLIKFILCVVLIKFYLPIKLFSLILTCTFYIIKSNVVCSTFHSSYQQQEPRNGSKLLKIQCLVTLFATFDLVFIILWSVQVHGGCVPVQRIYRVGVGKQLRQEWLKDIGEVWWMWGERLVSTRNKTQQPELSFLQHWVIPLCAATTTSTRVYKNKTFQMQLHIRQNCARFLVLLREGRVRSLLVSYREKLILCHVDVFTWMIVSLL